MAFEIRIFSGIIAGLIWAPVWHIIITVGLIVSPEFQLNAIWSCLTHWYFGWWINVIKKVENKLITLIIGSSLTFFSLILFSIESHSAPNY